MKKYKIEVFKGQDDQWYWRVVHINGQKLLVSEGYTTKQSAVEVSTAFYMNADQIDYLGVEEKDSE
jgi:uncharacterized protein YegP (UPF0339 family)